MADIKDAIFSFLNGPNTVTGKAGYGLRIVVGEFTGLFIQIFNAAPIGTDEEIAVIGSYNTGYVVCDKTFRIVGIVLVDGKGVLGIIVCIQSVALCSYPEYGILRIVKYTVQLVAGKALSAVVFFFIIGREVDTVKLVQSFFRRKP